MKLLERLHEWWMATERSEPKPVRVVPQDHFMKAHFDANGRYIFKDQKNKLVADYASQLAATMATVSFNTPVVLPYSAGSGVSSLTFNMTGVVSGQPIIVCVDNILVPGSVPGGSISDTFATGYTYTAGPINPYNDGQLTFIGTGGSGTSGSITISGMASTGSIGMYSTVYWGFAVSCIGANTGNYSAAVANASFGGNYGSTGNGQSWVPNPVTPTSNAQGLVLVTVATGGYFGYSLTSGPPSPWVNTTDSSSASSISLYSGPPNGVAQAPQYNFSANAGCIISSFLINPAPTAPSAPSLLTPTNSSYADVAAGETFTATYNSTDGFSQNAYAMRVKVSGGSYSYWNATSATLVGSAVWNSLNVAVGGTISVTLPTGALSDGHVYNWSIASQESGSNLQGSFASDNTFTAQQAPVTTISSPTAGNILTNLPTITWSSVFGGSLSQTDYQVIVESGTYGTVPGSGTSVWNSGVVASTVMSVICGATLTTGTSYRIFVQITQSGPQTGAWVYVTVTPTPNPPAAPLITASAYNDPTTGLPETQLTITGQDNLLTANQSSLESNATTGWAAGSNTTIAASTTWFQTGAYSLRLQASSSGAVSATTPTGTSGVAVSAGETVRAMAYFHSPTTGRSVTVAIGFYNSSGTLLSTSTSTTVTSTTTGNGTGKQAFYTGVAPANTAYAALIVNGSGLSSSEYLYVDCMLLAPGTSTTWTVGGFVGSQFVAITCSDGHLVRGAGWEGTAALSSGQSVTVYDVEAPPGIAYTYTAVITATVSGITVTSASSAASNSITNGPSTLFWLFDPTNPSGAVGFLMTANWQPKFHEVGQAYYPLGNPTTIKSTDGTKGLQGVIPIFTSSVAEEEAVEALLTTTNVLFFMTPQRGGYYVMSDPSQDRMGNAPPAWEGTTVPQVAWNFYALGAARP